MYTMIHHISLCIIIAHLFLFRSLNQKPPLDTLGSIFVPTTELFLSIVGELRTWEKGVDLMSKALTLKRSLIETFRTELSSLNHL